jgi:hypothetical protein
MSVGVVFTGAVVTNLAYRLVWGQFFQPIVVILVQATLVIVDENGSSLIGVEETQIITH